MYAAPTHSPQAPGSLVRFLHLTQEDGLSQNAGLAFLQDSRGFVWIGTQDGLNRYDGHTFTVYKNDPDNPTSLSYNSINALMEDRDGQIWIGTWGGGLNRFDPRTQQFTRFQHDPNNPISLSNDNVTSMLAGCRRHNLGGDARRSRSPGSADQRLHALPQRSQRSDQPQQRCGLDDL